MTNQESTTIQDELSKLDLLHEEHLNVAKNMLEAYGGAMYPMDLLAMAALNRSVSHISGFKSLIECKNLLCAGALLRLQLDTTLRFHAAFLVKEPHDFAMQVLAGEHIRKIKDRNGNKLRDAYLVELLGKEYPWIPNVYDRTSGYVHFSSVHMMGAFSTGEEDRTIEVKISAEDKPLPDHIYIECVRAFSASTQILLRYVHGWVATKRNPPTDKK